MEERRTTPFTEKLSWFMAIAAAAGGIYVIVDPVITFKSSWIDVKLGGEGFSEQLKGAVVALILIEGWKAVKEYWLGSSAGTVKSAETLQRIAESSPTATAAAVAAASVPAVTPAPPNPETGVIPAAEVAGQPPGAKS